MYPVCCLIYDVPCTLSAVCLQSAASCLLPAVCCLPSVLPNLLSLVWALIILYYGGAESGPTLSRVPAPASACWPRLDRETPQSVPAWSPPCPHLQHCILQRPAVVSCLSSSFCRRHTALLQIPSHSSRGFWQTIWSRSTRPPTTVYGLQYCTAHPKPKLELAFKH